MTWMDQRFHKDPEARTSTAQKNTPRGVVISGVLSKVRGSPSPVRSAADVVRFEYLGMRSFQMKLMFLSAVSNKICYQRLVSFQV